MLMNFRHLLQAETFAHLLEMAEYLGCSGRRAAGVKLGVRAGRSDPTGRTEALRELCERMPDA